MKTAVSSPTKTTLATVPAADPSNRIDLQAGKAMNRVASIDAYRGFVMLLMLSEVLTIPDVAKALPGNWFWAFLGLQWSHSPWLGCSLFDLIQPGFSFLVGVALPYSLARRTTVGQPEWLILWWMYRRRIFLRI